LWTQSFAVDKKFLFSFNPMITYFIFYSNHLRRSQLLLPFRQCLVPA
jgi:hypothetical protein